MYKKQELILVEIAVYFFYVSKGLLFEKIKASFNIIKNRKIINERYNQIQQKRKVTDKEIIQNFSDNIIVPIELSKSAQKSLFLNFIKNLSRRARKKIMSQNF